MENDDTEHAVEHYQQLREGGMDPLGAALKTREVHDVTLDVLYLALQGGGLVE